LLLLDYHLSGGVSTDLHVTFVEGAKIGDTILIDSRSQRQGSRLSQTYTEILLEKSGNPYQDNEHTGLKKKLVAYSSHTKIDVQLPIPLQEASSSSSQKQTIPKAKL
jgi:acyl-coenzyme A thioesterase PaaI-like protein